MESRKNLVILNPRSQNGATGRRWAAIEAKLRVGLGTLEVEATRTPRDAERIAREGVRAGVERIIVAGGDGTLSEVVTGLLAADLGHYVEIGLLPLGSGGDFKRTLGSPSDIDGAIRCIAEGRVRRIDAGRVTCMGDDGEAHTSFFLNVLSAGVGGLVTQLVNRSSKPFGGTVAFSIATVRGILRHDNRAVTIRVDGRTVFDGPLVLATAANGRYFGGGMHVAPRASLDDGELDVVIVPGLSKLRLLAKLFKIYTGSHLEDPVVRFFQGRVVEFVAPPGAVLIEVDGEPLGGTPVTVELLPGAISVIGPAPAPPPEVGHPA